MCRGSVPVVDCSFNCGFPIKIQPARHYHYYGPRVSASPASADQHSERKHQPHCEYSLSCHSRFYYITGNISEVLLKGRCVSPNQRGAVMTILLEQCYFKRALALVGSPFTCHDSSLVIILHVVIIQKVTEVMRNLTPNNSPMSSPSKHGDRFNPSRAGASWSINFHRINHCTVCHFNIIPCEL